MAENQYNDGFDWSFLNSFERRMEKIALTAALVRSSEYKQKWSQFGVKTVDAQLEILLVVILYIFRQSLQRNAGAKTREIAFMLYQWNGRFGFYDWDEDESLSLVQFIMDEIFYHSGSSSSLVIPEYGEDAAGCGNVDREPRQGSFIRLASPEETPGQKEDRFLMTEEGYRCMLATLEYQQNLSITEQTLLTKMRIESQNYDMAEQSILYGQEQIRTQCRVLEETARRYRQNIDYFSITAFSELLEKDAETVQGVITEMNGIRDDLLRQIEKLERAKDAEEDLAYFFKGEDLKKLLEMQRLLPMLSETLNMLTELVSRHNQIGSVVRSQIGSYLTTANSARMTVRQAFGQAVIDSPEHIERIPDLLAPLFFGKPGKVYNPTLLFGGMKITETEEDAAEPQLLIDVEGEQKRQRTLEKELRRGYQTAVSGIMQSVFILGGKAALSQIKRVFKENSELHDMVFADRDIAVEVLQSMLTAGDGEVIAFPDNPPAVNDRTVMFDRDRCIANAVRELDAGAAGVSFSRIDEPDLVMFYLHCGEKTETVSCTDFEISIIGTTEESANADDI